MTPTDYVFEVPGRLQIHVRVLHTKRVLVFLRTWGEAILGDDPRVRIDFSPKGDNARIRTPDGRYLDAGRHQSTPTLGMTRTRQSLPTIR